MKKVYILYIFITFLLHACSKPLVETGAIQGVVKDATTGAPIAGADVFLLQNEIGDGAIIGGGGPSEQIDYATSDADGKFSFIFNYDKNYYYLCGAEKELYFDLNQEFPVDDEIKEGTNVEVLLNPVAWLNVRIKAINDYEPSDFIAINSLQNDPYYGSVIDTAEIISVNGNYTFQLSWILY